MKRVTLGEILKVKRGLLNFNPHSRKESDKQEMYFVDTYINISIHTHLKGVTHGELASSEVIKISIHTPAKGVTIFRYKYIHKHRYFNPHSREGSDEQDYLPNTQKTENFNPHSREGSDEKEKLAMSKLESISIHTPAKGVTNGEQNLFKN